MFSTFKTCKKENFLERKSFINLRVRDAEIWESKTKIERIKKREYNLKSERNKMIRVNIKSLAILIM